MLNFYPAFGGKLTKERKEALSASSQYENGKFINTIATSMKMSLKEQVKVAFQFMRGNPKSRPSEPVKVETLNAARLQKAKRPAITWLGHSALLLEMDGKTILIDPMLGNAPSPFPMIGGKRFSKQLPIDIEQLPPIDAVLISHDHYDHLDYGSIMKLKDKVRRFFVPLGVGPHLLRWGVDSQKIAEGDWWDRFDYEGLTLACTPARHFSGRSLTDRNATLWCSWVIQGNDTSVFFSGDSGYGPHFGEIGDKYGPFDLTLMECGQYDDRWSSIHMMPEQTVQAHLDVRGKTMIPIHWGAFTLALHSWTDPVERAVKEAARLGAVIATPRIGETVYLDAAELPDSAWWTRGG